MAKDVQKKLSTFVNVSFNNLFLLLEARESYCTRDQFVLEARESYWIKQYKSLKNKPVNQIEHGLNLVP